MVKTWEKADKKALKWHKNNNASKKYELLWQKHKNMVLY